MDPFIRVIETLGEIILLFLSGKSYSPASPLDLVQIDILDRRLFNFSSHGSLLYISISGVA